MRNCTLCLPLLHRSLVMLRENRHSRFANCDSVIPVDGTRVTSHLIFLRGRLGTRLPYGTLNLRIVAKSQILVGSCLFWVLILLWAASDVPLFRFKVSSLVRCSVASLLRSWHGPFTISNDICRENYLNNRCRDDRCDHYDGWRVTSIYDRLLNVFFQRS